MDELAAAAGVSRATVFNRFGSSLAGPPARARLRCRRRRGSGSTGRRSVAGPPPRAAPDPRDADGRRLPECGRRARPRARLPAAYDESVRAVGFPVLVAGSLLAASSHPSSSLPERLFRHEASRMSMGCAYAIVVYGPDAAALPRIVEAAFDEVDRIDRLMSHYKPREPSLSRQPRGGPGPVGVDAELFAFLAECLRYSRDSGGAFDMTVGPLMKAWGFFRGGGRVPAATSSPSCEPGSATPRPPRPGQDGPLRRAGCGAGPRRHRQGLRDRSHGRHPAGTRIFGRPC